MDNELRCMLAEKLTDHSVRLLQIRQLVDAELDGDALNAIIMYDVDHESLSSILRKALEGKDVLA